MSKIWIVTNYGGGENYTPSIFVNEKEARAWMKELSDNNIIDGDYSKEDVKKSENEIIIGDPDDGGNVIQIFEAELQLGMKDIKVIINDDGELQAIYVPKEHSDVEVDVIDYYEDEKEAEKEWKKLEKQENAGEMVAIY